MDFRTSLLLGMTAFAVIGYFALVYGGCALDARCHLRHCGGRYLCGTVYDVDTPQPHEQGVRPPSKSSF